MVLLSSVEGRPSVAGRAPGFGARPWVGLLRLVELARRHLAAILAIAAAGIQNLLLGTNLRLAPPAAISVFNDRLATEDPISFIVEVIPAVHVALGPGSHRRGRLGADLGSVIEVALYIGGVE